VTLVNQGDMTLVNQGDIFMCCMSERILWTAVGYLSVSKSQSCLFLKASLQPVKPPPYSPPSHGPMYRVPVRLDDIGPASVTARQAGSDFCGNIHASVAEKEIQMPRSPSAPQNKNLDCFIGQNSREMFGNFGSGRSYALNRRIGAIETNFL
jgi:hypothetical protein